MDGNHENHALLNEYPVTEWNGGKVHQIQPSVFHLMRGQVFTIDGIKFFTMGGASSRDKQYRKEGVSWWSQELPSREEYEEVERNLAKHDWDVDFVLTRCAPTSVQDYFDDDYITDELTEFFESLSGRLNWKMWYTGHYHRDETFGKYHLLYHDILEISKGGIMISTFGKIKGSQYKHLIDFLLNKCDVFTFCLPNFGKKEICTNRSFCSDNPNTNGFSLLDNGENFEFYKKKTLPKIDMVKNQIIKKYYDINYASSRYDREREIYLVKIDSLLNINFFDNSGLFDWKYPNYPEDICFYANGKCFMETVSHEDFCFIYDCIEEVKTLLNILNIDYWETSCEQIPMLEY